LSKTPITQSPNHAITKFTIASRSFAVAVVTCAAFIDILAYSIAVPVLPDISRRFGASPTTIGLLFASFGLTVLVTSIPMGTISDRTSRRAPLVGGMIALSASTVLFALAPSLSWLFAARLVQGAADAVTWVVGFAVVADLYSAEERGRVMGLVMSGTTLGFLLGPTIGGWLYETGGAQLPYLVVAGLAGLGAIGCALLQLPKRHGLHEDVPLGAIARVPAVGVCVIAVVLGGGTIAMVEPVLSLHLSSLGLGPARIGAVFGAGAVLSAVFHPVFGRVADRVGGRALTFWGLAAMGCVLPIYTTIWNFSSAIVINGTVIVAVAMFVTPSLTYMAEAISYAGTKSFGVAYGLYNFAWALGILVGPSLGGFFYERAGFPALAVGWAVAVVALTIVLAMAEQRSRRSVAL
jgi:DHA1 family solute carrier family 18 vesicular amine transporter 1/2